MIPVGDELVRLGIRHRRRAGFTLVDVVAAMFILLVAIGGFFGAITSSLQLSDTVDEVAIADEALTQFVERLDWIDFEDRFAVYNADPTDDPGGAGTSPGAHFAVPGLRPRRDDPDGFVGQVIFPTAPSLVGTLELREDVEDQRLGMPRDLNGDGDVDSNDHAEDYTLLPVTIRLEWVGLGGNGVMQRSVLLAQ